MTQLTTEELTEAANVAWLKDIREFTRRTGVDVSVIGSESLLYGIYRMGFLSGYGAGGNKAAKMIRDGLLS